MAICLGYVRSNFGYIFGHLRIRVVGFRVWLLLVQVLGFWIQRLRLGLRVSGLGVCRHSQTRRKELESLDLGQDLMPSA